MAKTRGRKSLGSSNASSKAVTITRGDQLIALNATDNERLASHCGAVRLRRPKVLGNRVLDALRSHRGAIRYASDDAREKAIK
jgi:hypothetical protein